MLINEYYQNMPKDGKKAFRNKVCEKLSIAYPTFYYRLKVGYKWKEHESQIIKGIINELQ